MTALYVEGLQKHQADAVSWLLEQRARMLAWEMGVGKTAPLLRAWENSSHLGPALVICLASARANWAREAAKFALDRDWPPRVQIPDTLTPIDPAADLVIVNYEKLRIPQVAKKLRAARRWGALILDEAHRLKTCDAAVTRVIYQGAKGLGGGLKGRPTPALIDNCEHVWLATGTPMPNHPGELYSHMAALWPDRLQYNGHTMAEWEFQAAFCEIQQTKYGPQIVGGRNLAELKERLAPVMSRILRKDVLDLPPCRITTWPLDASGLGKVPDLPELLGTLRERYGCPDEIETFDNATLEAYLSCIDAGMSHLATLRRETAVLKGICVGMMVKEELECGAGKTVLFAHHREALTTLAKILAEFKPAVIHGGVPLSARQSECDRFQSDAACKVFLGQISAAGASINLQAGKNVVFVEASWCPADNEQALARVYRMGQVDPVLVRFTYLGGSIDEPVQRALARKTAMISQVI